MIAEVYDALRSAGADDDRARRAAEAVAEWKGETQGLRKEMSELRVELRTELHKVLLELEKVRGEISILKWMFGALIVLNSGILVRLLFS